MKKFLSGLLVVAATLLTLLVLSSNNNGTIASANVKYHTVWVRYDYDQNKFTGEVSNYGNIKTIKVPVGTGKATQFSQELYSKWNYTRYRHFNDWDN